ncbi:LMP-2B [macacine gammaherpesvirus 13]|nr:LMP-2B [Macaca arctoides gammaherpesvirus 1]AYA49791.1 LMP-2B [Macaca arctoides gammaherpesvirus 1]
MGPAWLPVVCAPFLFWLAAIAASCYSASVTTLVATTGLALSLLILTCLVNWEASARRRTVTAMSFFTALVTFFGIRVTWLLQPKTKNITVYCLLAAAGVLQAIYVIFMFVVMLLETRRRWRKRTVILALLFLLCFILLIADAIYQLSPLLGAMTVVSMTLLTLAFILWLSSPTGAGAMGAALLCLAAALALLASLILGPLNLATMFLLMFLWTLGNKHLMVRWLLYALALLLLASALACGGKILMQVTEDMNFFPGEHPKANKIFSMLLLITAGILFILAILIEWGTGGKIFGLLFVSLSGILTLVAGLIWLLVIEKPILSAWCLTSGLLVFCIGFILFGIMRFCRCCCPCCLQLEAEDPPTGPYRNDVP